MREIGGYFELERFGGRAYHEGAIELNCGRSCLEYLIELRDIKRIWLPDFLCDSVYELCNRMRVEVEQYAIQRDFGLPDGLTIGDGDFLYLVDFYGQLSSRQVSFAIKLSGGRLIVDESQGFFRMPWPDSDTLYTCRKFFGVADGGYLYTRDEAKILRDIPESFSHAQMGFLLGRFEEGAGMFFEESKRNNARFVQEGLKLMSPITRNLLNAVDYEEARSRRDANWAILHKAFGDTNKLSLRFPRGAFMYPLLIGDATGIREAMAKRGIYIPMLWPGVSDRCPSSSVAGNYAKNILPLLLDQRYGEDDMRMLIDSLKPILPSCSEEEDM